MSMTDVIIDRLPKRGRVGRMFSNVRRKYGYADPPLAISILLTERCNLHCHMCPHGEGTVSAPGGRSNPDMIDFDLVEKTLRELAPYGTEVGLMGGEPTLHPQCVDIIKSASSKGLRTNLVTNGTLLKKYAEDIVGSGLTSINLSLDGPEEVHDTVRGQKTSYKRAIDGVKAIREAAQNGAGPDPELHIFCVITGENHRNLLEFVEEVTPLRPSHVQLNHLRFFTSAEVREHKRVFQELFNRDNDDPAGYVKEIDEHGIDVDVVRDQLGKIRNREWPFMLLINPGHSDAELDAYYKNNLYERTALRTCHAVYTYACIGPSGEVYPCLKNNCGYLTEKPFLAIWNGPRWRNFRRQMDRIERLPACHRCCF